MADTLKAEKRETRGKRNARRDRARGRTPAVLYGHGAENVSLSVDSNALAVAVQHGSPLIELAGDLKESALISDIQWDPMGNRILHIDFTRVKADERIEVSVSVELRGVAPGTNAGGVINQMAHDTVVECAAVAIPEKVEININHLELGQSITAGEIELPEGVKLTCSSDMIFVQCNEPSPDVDEEAQPIGIDGAEPEVIGRKASDEEATDAAES
ncbi:MAG: 50S ribosomal protein L25 [Planctomycetaceae bacterium]|nr:50S ribosomal protein L25 [Planctomycetaceae bacterium]|tara:strand:- start:3623 stop:4267 length:645 start_codon:yes stop_codon:yes gene_type:complete